MRTNMRKNSGSKNKGGGKENNNCPRCLQYNPPQISNNEKTAQKRSYTLYETDFGQK